MESDCRRIGCGRACAARIAAPGDLRHALRAGSARDDRRLQRSPACRGFSLLELVIILAALGLIFMVVSPLIGRQASTDLRGAASIVAADLAFAQVASLSNALDPRMVVFDLANNRYHVAASSDPDTPITNPADGQPYLVRFGFGNQFYLDSVAIDSIDFDGDDFVQFGAYGQVVNASTASITLTAGSDSLTITIDTATGEITVGEIN